MQPDSSLQQINKIQDEVEATVRQADKLGAQVVLPPTDIPEVGRFAILKDPYMAEFAVITYLKK